MSDATQPWPDRLSINGENAAKAAAYDAMLPVFEEMLEALQAVEKAMAYGNIKQPTDKEYVNSQIVLAERTLAKNKVRAAVERASKIKGETPDPSAK